MLSLVSLLCGAAAVAETDALNELLVNPANSEIADAVDDSRRRWGGHQQQQQTTVTTYQAPRQCSTGRWNVLQCGDGSYCSVTRGMGWNCCSHHRGRARCPRQKPYFCHNEVCSSHPCTPHSCGATHRSTGKLTAAHFGRYPGFTGPEMITGWFSVEVDPTTKFLRLTYNLQGLERSTHGGVHIHEGKTCDDKNLVGGHYYNKQLYGTIKSDDPWDAPKGTPTAHWQSNSWGQGSGSFVLNSGYNTLDDNAGRAVVVHLSDGTRAACGLLYPSMMGHRGRRLEANVADLMA